MNNIDNFYQYSLFDMNELMYDENDLVKDAKIFLVLNI